MTNSGISPNGSSRIGAMGASCNSVSAKPVPTATTKPAKPKRWIDR